MYHLIIGKNINEVLPKIIGKYPITAVFTLTKTNLGSSIVKIYELPIISSEFNDPVELAAKIVAELTKSIDSNDKTLLITIVNGNPIEIIASFLIAQSKQVCTSIISNDFMSTVYPLDIIQISEDEDEVLRYLNKENSAESLGKVATDLKWGNEKNVKAIARVAYAVNKLSNKGYIKRTKDGRTVKVEIEDKGRQYQRIFTS